MHERTKTVFINFLFDANSILSDSVRKKHGHTRYETHAERAGHPSAGAMHCILCARAAVQRKTVQSVRRSHSSVSKSNLEFSGHEMYENYRALALESAAFSSGNSERSRENAR